MILTRIATFLTFTFGLGLPVCADEVVATKLRALSNALDRTAFVSDAEITCTTGGQTWKFALRSTRAGKQRFQSEEASVPPELETLFPSGLCVALALAYLDPLSPPSVAAAGMSATLLPPETLEGVRCEVIEMAALRPTDGRLPYGLSAVTVRWYIGPDGLPRRVIARCGLPPHLRVEPNGSASLIITSDARLRAPRTASARPALEPAHTLTSPQNSPEFSSHVAYSPDGRTLAVAHADGTATLVDTQTWNATTLRVAPDKPVTRLVFSRDGRRLVTVALDGRMRLWDTERRIALQSLDVPSPERAGVALSPDGHLLAGVFDTEVMVVDSATRRTVFKGEAYSEDADFSSDGKMLAVADFTGVKLIETAGWKEARTLVPPRPGAFGGFSTGPSPFAFSADGKLLAVGDTHTGSNGRAATSPHRVHIFEVATGRLVQSLIGPAGPVRSLVFSTDGHWLAASDSDLGGEAPGPNGGVTIWETSGWTRRLSFAGGETAGLLLAFSPDGSRLAGGGAKGVRVWRMPPLAPK